MKKQTVKLDLEKRPIGVMHRTENKASGTTHDAYVFQDGIHRTGRVSGEVYLNKSVVEENGRPVAITIHFESD